MPDKVLVTGGAGYIGSHTAYALLDAGCAVIVLDNLSNTTRDMVPSGAAFVEGDIGDRSLTEQILKAEGIRAVIHFAGSIVVPESVANPLAYYKNNVVQSQSLIESCVAQGVKHIIFSSSAAVYGIPDRVPITEDDPTRPINPYGHTKLIVEQMLRDVSAVNPMTHVALRYFNVAGADPDGRTGQVGKSATHLIKIAAQVVTGKRPTLTVFGDDYDTPDGTCVRDYIHVTDLAQAHLAALSFLARDGQSLSLNCGYGRGYSVFEVISAIEAVTGKPLDKKIGPRRPGDPPALVASSKRAREVLEWRPAHADLKEIVASAIAWERRLTG